MPVSAPTQERRRAVRVSGRADCEISLLRPDGLLTAESVNVSEGGLCLRVRQMLEVRSLVDVQMVPAKSRASRARRPVRCAARVTWVMQRLDLRDAPPFFFDTGIEFINPSPQVRQCFAQSGIVLPASERAALSSIEPAKIHGRRFVPALERGDAEAGKWHLVISVEGVPCFSEHYASQRAALAAWAKFKRQQAKR
jgi:hypothetical protein